jgi:ketosteroid isomerase-like protein
MDVAKRVIDAYNDRDVDGFFAELATLDFEWRPALTKASEGGFYRGREGVERFVADTSENWEELQAVAEEFRDLGDRALVLGRLEGREKGSRAPLDAPSAVLLDFRGDRIWRARPCFGGVWGLRAAGLSE